MNEQQKKFADQQREIETKLLVERDSFLQYQIYNSICRSNNENQWKKVEYQHFLNVFTGLGARNWIEEEISRTRESLDGKGERNWEREDGAREERNGTRERIDETS